MASDFYKFGAITVRVRDAGGEDLRSVKVSGPGADLDLLVPFQGRDRATLAKEILDELASAAVDPETFMDSRKMAADVMAETDFERDRMMAFAETAAQFAKLMRRHLAHATKVREPEKLQGVS